MKPMLRQKSLRLVPIKAPDSKPIRCCVPPLVLISPRLVFFAVTSTTVLVTRPVPTSAPNSGLTLIVTN